MEEHQAFGQIAGVDAYHYVLGNIHGIFYRGEQPHKTYREAFAAGMESLRVTGTVGRVWVDYYKEV